jgi:hypothetical protein
MIWTMSALAAVPGAGWWNEAPRVSVESETTGMRWTPPAGPVQMESHRNGSNWELNFTSKAKRTGYTVRIEFPVLRRGMRIFTPSERGTMEVDAYPSYRGVEYGHNSWTDGRSWVLPLVSVMDPKTDRALTIALEPGANIPHLEIGWSDAHRLVFELRHRGIGGGTDSPLRLLFYEHAADYRAALAAYSKAFPAYFEPVVRRRDGEGAFYYHHIQNHPDFDEMQAQRVRMIWSSFWFTHLGEFLPAEREWAPYTYAKQWKLGEMMSDQRIGTFIGEMQAHGVATYAYFNVNEYGGAGGKAGNAEAAAQLLKERFANALMHNEKGANIPTWEGAMAMNPSPKYALWPVLEEQVKRHLDRLPGIAGFIIDRLDWSSHQDWAHQDGLSMDGARGFENMAPPVAAAVQNVCRLAHQAGKRVFVNQFYRIEVLKDTDGVCHENDYLPGIAYLAPLKPISAWHLRARYNGDLLLFEAQMKRRLHWALFPQMIAHSFEISQQKPNEHAADMLELYAPLFDTLMGKRQVLDPHVVEASGANDVNLFVNADGNFVVPLISRVRFLSRGNTATEIVHLRLRERGIRWAHLYRLGEAPERVNISGTGGVAELSFAGHGTASVVVLGRGAEPPLGHERVRRSIPAGAAPAETEAKAGELRIEGESVGVPGRIEVLADGRPVGWLEDTSANLPIGAATPRRIELRGGDEGNWFVVSRIRVGGREWNANAGRSGRGTLTGSQWYELSPAHSGRAAE